MNKTIKPCPWCNNHKGEDELSFTIIDDDCGQYVTEKLIRFCPFCGKELRRMKK